MSPFYERHGITVHDGDCLDILRELDGSSVDAIVTDPPYGLSTISPAAVTVALTAWAAGDREHVPDARGFMGRNWDAFVPPPAVWDECLRVLKPGGHLLAFAGSRTADLMGLSVRMAGFEIRDTIMWIYGAGFPKSLDVSKGIDKARDDRADIVRVTTYLAAHAEARGITRADVDAFMGTSDMGGWWLSRLVHRCQVPRWEQWERLRGLLGFGNEMDTEVWRLNGRKGTPGEAWSQREVIGERRTGCGTGRGDTAFIGDSENRDLTAPATAAAREWQGWGTALKPAHEPIIVARKPLAGTVAGNVLAHGTGALNIDACRVGDGPRPAAGTRGRRPRGMGEVGERTGDPMPNGPTYAAGEGGRWPSNVLFDEHAADELDQQSGISKSSDRPRRNTAEAHNRTASMGKSSADWTTHGHDDTGGASRFFPVFRWEGKAPSSERPQVGGVSHPTVKPLDLMRWLVRLVTPPGGVVLDPFAGSGTTLHAARAEAFRAMGIEREPAYLPLIVARLDARPRTTDPAPDVVDEGPLDLLDLLGVADD